MGWSSEKPHEINQAFAAFAASCTLPVLDIGVGFGAASIAALRAGAHVIANDIDGEVLNDLAGRTDKHLRDRLTLCRGCFPAEVNFPLHSLGAIHASNVLHFLHPTDLALGITRMFDWLVPSGKVFVMVNSTYGVNFKDYAPQFLEKKEAGAEWPGWVEDLHAFSTHPSLEHIPDKLHLFDAEILARAFTNEGFVIETAKEFRRSYLP